MDVWRDTCVSPMGNTNYASYRPEMVLLKNIELGKSEVENSNSLLHEFILNSLVS